MIDIPRCIIHKRIAEFYLKGKHLCDKCLTEVMGYERAWLYRVSSGEYWLSQHELDDNGSELILADVPFLEAWSKLMELAPLE